MPAVRDVTVGAPDVTGPTVAVGGCLPGEVPLRHAGSPPLLLLLPCAVHETDSTNDAENPAQAKSAMVSAHCIPLMTNCLY